MKRREFLRGLGTLGAASLLPSCVTMEPAASRPRLIDTPAARLVPRLAA